MQVELDAADVPNSNIRLVFHTGTESGQSEALWKHIRVNATNIDPAPWHFGDRVLFEIAGVARFKRLKTLGLLVFDLPFLSDGIESIILLGNQSAGFLEPDVEFRH